MGLFDLFKKDKPQNQGPQRRNSIKLGDIHTDTGIIRDVIEYDFDMVQGKVFSKQWGDDFKLVCDRKTFSLDENTDDVYLLQRIEEAGIEVEISK